MTTICYPTFNEVNVSDAEINLIQTLMDEGWVTVAVKFIREQHQLNRLDEAWNVCKAIQQLGK